jgi:hypothetical protein
VIKVEIKGEAGGQENKNKNKDTVWRVAINRDSPEWKDSWGLYGSGGWEASASSQMSLGA